MSISVVTQTILGDNGIGTSPTALSSITPVAGNLLVAGFLATSGSLTVSALTDNKNGSWTQVPGVYKTDSGEAIDLWYVENCQGGSTIISITVSANGQGTNIDLIVTEFSGASTSGALRVGSGANSTDTTSPPHGQSLTATAIGDLLVSCCMPEAISYSGTSAPWTGSNIAGQRTASTFVYYITPSTSPQQADLLPTTSQLWFAGGAIFQAATGISTKQKASTNLVF